MSGRYLIGAISSAKSQLTHSYPSKSYRGIQNLGILRSFSVAQVRNMKFLQFSYKETPEEIRVGRLDADRVIDINKADPNLPSTLVEILKQGHADKVKHLEPAVPLSTVTLRAPITGMDKVICMGLNYLDHCEEQNIKAPPVPMFFNKFPSCIIGPNEPVRIRTDVVEKCDWEVELVVIIGKKANKVKAADAYNYVLGYTIGQDITARDWQREKNMGQFLLAKAMDTYCPLGPWIVTHDEMGDPENLNINCSVNGVMKQKSNTSKLIHKIPDVIERLTSVLTLLPGDIILTGSPGGVGMFHQPPEFLHPGDVIRNEIEKIGSFEVKIVKL